METRQEQGSTGAAAPSLAASDEPMLREIDEALAATPLTEPASIEANTSSQKRRALTSSLRAAALVVLLTAAGSFLFQGWAGWNSVERIGAFLAFNAALAATGLFCAFRFKDTKGARVSLGLATAIIPVAFSQCGGLIFSLFPQTASYMPELLRFTAPSAPIAAVTTALTVALLGGIAYAGFSVLARAEAPALTLAYLIANSALLFPTRDPNVVGILAMTLMSGALMLDIARFHQRPELRTLEGTLSRAMIFTPLAVLIFRNLALYSMSSIMIGCLLAVATTFLFVVLPQVCENEQTATRSQALSTLTMAGSWFCFAHALFFEQGALLALSGEFRIPVMMLPVSLGLAGMSLLTVSSGTSYRRSAAYLAIAATVLELFTEPGLVSAFFCILTSVLCIGAGCALEEKGLLKAGGLGLGVGVLYHLRFAIQIYDGLGPWMSLAILGIAVLLLSSYLERHYATLAERLTILRSRLAGWK